MSSMPGGLPADFDPLSPSVDHLSLIDEVSKGRSQPSVSGAWRGAVSPCSPLAWGRIITMLLLLLLSLVRSFVRESLFCNRDGLGTYLFRVKLSANQENLSSLHHQRRARYHRPSVLVAAFPADVSCAFRVERFCKFGRVFGVYFFVPNRHAYTHSCYHTNPFSATRVLLVLRHLMK